jgi:hypothetical protein
MEFNLPMKFPVITCYPNHANLLSVISRNENYVHWFFNNYIQLFVDKNDLKRNYLRIDFFTNDPWMTCPWIHSQKISRSIIEKMHKTSIIDFFIESLMDNCYIYVIVDTFYVSKYQSFYNQDHQVHDLFIYGFNSEKKVFYAADNFLEGKYSYEAIPFSEIEEAYNQVKDLDLEDWLEGVQLLSYREKNIFWGLNHDYKFDTTKLEYELKDYLSSYKTVKRYFNPYYQWMIYASDLGFGVDIYTVLNDYLMNVEDVSDKRPFYVFWEHKKVMLMRIKYLEENLFINTILSDAYSEIEQSAKLLNNLYLKYIIRNDMNLRLRIIENLELIKNREVELLSLLLRSLN